MIEQITPARVRITALEERPNAKTGEKQASPSKRVVVYTSSHVFHTLYGYQFLSKGILFYPGGEGDVSPRKSMEQSAWQYDVTSHVSDFQNGEPSVHRRDG